MARSQYEDEELLMWFFLNSLANLSEGVPAFFLCHILEEKDILAAVITVSQAELFKTF